MNFYIYCIEQTCAVNSHSLTSTGWLLFAITSESCECHCQWLRVSFACIFYHPASTSRSRISQPDQCNIPGNWKI